MRRHPGWLAAAAVAVAAAGCLVIGNEQAPIRTLLVPAPAGGPADEVVIMLPGIGADARMMEQRGIAAAVHRSWPEVDVLLTDATFAYYVHRVLVPRLDREVVQPARARYRKVWLAGASIGGMGALLYERTHPGTVDGLVLFAPWLGDGDLIDEILDAGGVARWEPGPLPETIDGDNFDREIWRLVQQWSRAPDAARRVWMACGDADSLGPGHELLGATLPPRNYVEVPGGHTWEVWIAAAELIMKKVRADTRTAPQRARR